jgi:pantoate--beta-alanine ligase
MVRTFDFFKLISGREREWDHKSIDIRRLLQQQNASIPCNSALFGTPNTMDVIEEAAAAAAWSATQRRAGRRVGFVPTMGALHAGHLQLMREALDRCEAVAVSIFVNPLQFNNKEDLKHYPRQLEQDLAMLRQGGCHMVFTPQEAGIYQDHIVREYELAPLDLVLEGPTRPGHFQGMVNVVERLFHFVRPDLAFFGEKDRQQLCILQHVARQLRWPEQIVPVPTQRAADGLALSSRNQRLTEAERALAPLLHASLQAVASKAFSTTVTQARQAGVDVLKGQPAFQLEYLEVAHPKDLHTLDTWEGLDEVLVLVAAHLGAVRLIDNIAIHR